MRETHIIGPHTRERIGALAGEALVGWTGLTYVGLSIAGAGFSFVTRGWRYSQVLVCYGGAGQVQVGGQWVTCRAGQAYLTPAGLPHAYRADPHGLTQAQHVSAPSSEASPGTGRTVGVSESWKLVWVTYDPAVARLPLDELDEAILVHVNPRPFKWAVLGFCEELLGRRDPAILHSWAEAVRLHAQRMSSLGKRTERLWPLWHAVDADPSRPWTLELLARRAHLSAEHLRRLCQTETNRTPMEQVAHLRMRRAAGLLRATEMKIDAIAQAVGYADRFGFSQAFKRCLGLSPAAYRRNAVSSQSA